MANVQVQNIAQNTSGEKFTVFWWLTRAMKQAGWRYKASSDGVVKDTSANPNNDKWGNGRPVQATVTGAFTIGTPSSTAFGGRSTLTGLSGMTTNSAGHFLKITGATNGANNGTWLITRYISATSVQIENPAAIAETTGGGATWTELSALLDVYSNTTASPTLTRINVSSASQPEVTLITCGAASTMAPGPSYIQWTTATSAKFAVWWTIDGVGTTPSPATTTVLGPAALLSSDTASTVATKIAAQMVGVGFTATATGNQILLTNTGLAAIAATTYTVALTTGAWWCAQGPSTLKVPIGTVSFTTPFIKGENVTQGTTGATGEIIGVYVDTVNGGYLVISPRSSGTGGGVRGWDNAHAITGTTSGATVTPAGTVLEYVREIVFWFNSATNGHIYYQTIESVTEATTTILTGRFSTMAALATATATICPGGATGGNPTTNGFPTTGTFVAGIGSGGSGSAATNPGDWCLNSSGSSIGLGQILVANMIEDATVSGDGSFTWVIGEPSINNTSWQGCAFIRLDDQEDGDLDPFIWCVSNNPTSGLNRARTGSTTLNTNSDGFSTGSWFTGTVTALMGHRRRGFPTGDTYSEFQTAVLATFVNNAAAIATTPNSPDRVACAFTNIAVREPIWVVYQQTGQPQTKTRKGTMRWWYMGQGGNASDTYDGKKWLQLSSAPNTILVGPWDGVTAPLNQ